MFQIVFQMFHRFKTSMASNMASRLSPVEHRKDSATETDISGNKDTNSVDSNTDGDAVSGMVNYCYFKYFF